MFTPVAPPKPLTEAEYEAAADQLLQEMYALNALMKDSDQSRAQYREDMERLKAESKQLREEGIRQQAALRTALDHLTQTGHLSTDREVTRLDRENLMLRLENTFLKSGHVLPPFGETGAEPRP